MQLLSYCFHLTHFLRLLLFFKMFSLLVFCLYFLHHVMLFSLYEVHTIGHFECICIAWLLESVCTQNVLYIYTQVPLVEALLYIYIWPHWSLLHIYMSAICTIYNAQISQDIKIHYRNDNFYFLIASKCVKVCKVSKIITVLCK